LDEDLKKAKDTIAANAAGAVSGPKLTVSAPKIREIGADSSKDAEMKFSQEINELRKQVAEKDSQLGKLNQDLVEAQTQLAQSKASGPQDASNANMMSLLADLQTKNKKLKDQLRQKEEELAKAKGGN
jgi:capsule polysaccharide export protein KpsE/RkpR